MEKAYSLAEIRKLYPRNIVQEVPDGFRIYPDKNSPLQGRDILQIPKTLPIVRRDLDNNMIPYDYTTIWGLDIVEEIFEALNVDEYDDLYCACCRFGRFQQNDDQSIFQITSPKEASHVYLMGIKDLVAQGWMAQSNPVEECLDHIAEDHYEILAPLSGDVVRGWILRRDFRFETLLSECEKEFQADISAITLQ